MRLDAGKRQMGLLADVHALKTLIAWRRLTLFTIVWISRSRRIRMIYKIRVPAVGGNSTLSQRSVAVAKRSYVVDPSSL